MLLNMIERELAKAQNESAESCLERLRIALSLVCNIVEQISKYERSFTELDITEEQRMYLLGHIKGYEDCLRLLKGSGRL